MGGFFGELAKKLADQWIGLLALPGLLFVASAWAGEQLGWSHAVDLGLLTARVTAFGSALTRSSGPAQALTVAGSLLASGGVALAVQALAGPVRYVWLGHWPVGLRWAAQRRTMARARRWHHLAQLRTELQSQHPKTSRTPVQQAAIDALAHQANRLALAAPVRPTWMGDRIAAVEQIGADRYGLDLKFGWSRMWLVLPDAARAELAAANGQFAATVVTAAWALPCLVLGAWWWPALLISLAVGLTGWTRARSAIAELTDLSEAALDLYGRTLAAALGAAPPGSSGPLALSEGREITRQVRKGR